MNPLLPCRSWMPLGILGTDLWRKRLMPTVQIEAHLSRAQLLQAVKQLPSAELDEFADEVLALRAHRRAPGVGPAETDLLLKINQGLPDAVRQRYRELIAKRQDETLTSEEHAELLQ